MYVNSYHSIVSLAYLLPLATGAEVGAFDDLLFGAFDDLLFGAFEEDFGVFEDLALVAATGP